MTKKFVSPANSFAFDYPDDWKLKLEGKSTLMLFKKTGMFQKKSKCALRISNLILDKKADTTALTEKLKDLKTDYQLITKGNAQVVRYTQNVNEKSRVLIQDWWFLHIDNNVFACSFSLPAGQETAPGVVRERNAAENIVYNIRLL
jgi:hypothetical protein